MLSAEIDELGKDVLLTDVEKVKLMRMKTASASLVRATGGFLDEVAAQIEANDQLTVGPRLKIYFNTYVRQGRKVNNACLLYTSPSPRDATLSRMPSSA